MDPIIDFSFSYFLNIVSLIKLKMKALLVAYVIQLVNLNRIFFKQSCIFFILVFYFMPCTYKHFQKKIKMLTNKQPYNVFIDRL